MSLRLSPFLLESDERIDVLSPVVVPAADGRHLRVEEVAIAESRWSAGN